jgi:hypothetical protein
MSEEINEAPLPPVENAPTPKTPGLGLGAAVLLILLTTMPLLGLLYLAAQLLHLPFVPFDLFGWPIRAGFAPWVSLINTLSGAQVTAGGNIAQSAPVVRWVLSVSLFLLIALVLGLAFYLFVLRRGRIPDWLDGLMIGILFGAPMIFVSLATGSSPLPAWMSVLWLAALFVGWGLVLSYAFRRLLLTTRTVTTDDELSADGGIDRRQFLIQFGAGATVITAFSAAAGANLAPGKSAELLQATLPMASPEFLEAQRELFGNFRRFAIVRLSGEAATESNVVALGAEYPDRNYVSVWLGGNSPIVVYENLETALGAYSAGELKTAIYWLDE